MSRKRAHTFKPGDRFVEGFADHIVVPAGRKEILVWDAGLGGFGCRKSNTGHASYVVQYDIGNSTRRLTLGAVVEGNLKQMRLMASEVLAKRRLGQDAVEEKREALAPIATIGELLPDYLRERRTARPGKAAMKPRAYEEIVRHLEKTAKPLHAKGVTKLTRQELDALLDGIAEERGLTAADRIRSSISTFYAWAIDNHHAEANPCLGIKDRAPNTSRDRTLSPAELREVWLATDQHHDHDRIVRLLILTGQRREEIGGLAWSEVDLVGRRVHLPGERTKNGKPHIVPLSTPALAILASVDRREGERYVFGRLDTPFSGWSRCKERLDARIAARRRKARVKEPIQPWRLHDLRRTFVTLIGELGIAPPHVVEAIVNHISGHRAGVAGVYNKALYLDERVRAVEAWGAYVTDLARGQAMRAVGCTADTP